MYLVLEVDGRVEVGDLDVDGFAEHLVLDVVHKFAHFWYSLAGPERGDWLRIPKTWSGGPNEEAPPNPPRPAHGLAGASQSSCDSATHLHGE
jgi:hypothetical protein